jgi:hypothetical protein
MVISHKYKFLYVELPHTASTAISAELCELYGGEKILRKHARYHEFLKIATDEEKKYFVFSGIRNPLDEIVSIYLKFKSNHKNRFTTPSEWKRNGGGIPDSMLSKYNFVCNNPDFEDYFRKYYKFPYDNWSCLAHKKFGFVIKFENLQEDFAKVLQLLKIEQIRELPHINKTKLKEESYEVLFNNEKIRSYAQKICGGFMEEWGYDLPNSWKKNKFSTLYDSLYRVQKVFRVIYYKK